MHLSGKLKATAALLLIAAAFWAGVYTGAAEKITSAAEQTITLNLGGDTKPETLNFAQFWRAWNLLNQSFVETNASTTIPTDQERIYGAIAGLTESYGDPYTVFLPPAEAKSFIEDIEGEFGGVGMELGLKEERLVVVAPLKDSPAEKAGVRSGDFVIGIDDKSTQGMKVEDGVKVIRGPKGTPVKLTFERPGVKDPIVITIVRDTIHIPLIEGELREDGIYVISLYSFSANSAELFRGELRKFMESGSKKLILDLRGNPGGYLEAAVQMASFFLPQGDVIVTEDYKGKRDNVYHRSVGYNVFANRELHMAVLVDQGSASASEILAGALNEHDVAELIGKKTFGKGSVQQLLDLGGGAQIKVTVARWLTPDGTSLSDGGLTPNLEVDRTIEDFNAGKDPQLDAAVRYLSTR